MGIVEIGGGVSARVIVQKCKCADGIVDAATLLLTSAFAPTAVFSEPVVLSNNAAVPTAVL